MEANMLSNVPTFILKLWRMLESKNPEVSEIMQWSPSGTSFIIKDKITFITKLLPMYFKHNNMGSFIRQLNLYDFHKIYARANNNELEYQHKHFQKCSPETLNLIKRKLPRTTRVLATTQDSLELSAISKELNTVKGKQDKIMRQMTSLQRENLNLLKDLKGLHVRQNNQTQVLTNILETLIPYVQNYPGASSGSSNASSRSNALEPEGFFNTNEDIISKLDAISDINQEEEATSSDDNSNALLPRRSGHMECLKPEYVDFEMQNISEDVDDPPNIEFNVEDFDEQVDSVESQESLDEISRFLQGDDTIGIAFDIGYGEKQNVEFQNNSIVD